MVKRDDAVSGEIKKLLEKQTLAVLATQAWCLVATACWLWRISQICNSDKAV